MVNHAYDIISELNHISPNLLLHILPNIELDLKDDDAEKRLKAVQLLCDMFQEPGSQLASMFTALFHSFLGRFKDAVCYCSLLQQVECTLLNLT